MVAVGVLLKINEPHETKQIPPMNTDTRKLFAAFHSIKTEIHDMYFGTGGDKTLRKLARGAVSRIRFHLDHLTEVFDQADKLRQRAEQIAPPQPNPENVWEKVAQLLMAGWSVERKSMYDEDGVEGWEWTSPTGDTYETVGAWDEAPELPEGVV